MHNPLMAGGSNNLKVTFRDDGQCYGLLNVLKDMENKYRYVSPTFGFPKVI